MGRMKRAIVHQPVAFAHPSEAEFAQILDFYRIAWQYEPRTFSLVWDEEGKVLEAFTPDFYLPEYDLYVELTTLQQGLTTRKHRKVRQLQKLYPHIRIKLVDRGGFDEILMKHGLESRREELIGQSAVAHSSARPADGRAK